MKFILYLTCIFYSLSLYAAIDDQVSSSKEVVGTIQMDDDYFYFVAEDQNWSALNCPNAKFAYINIMDINAKSLYSAALTSKVTKSPIEFRGLCGNNSGDDRYIRINYMVF